MTSPRPAAGSAAAPAPASGSVPLGAAPTQAPVPGAGPDPYPSTGVPVTPRDRQSRDRAVGARPLTDPSRHRRTPLAWLPWAALAALLFLLAASVLAATLAGRDDTGSTLSATADREAQGDGARGDGSQGDGSQGDGSQGGSGAGGTGSLTAGSTDLLSGGRVADLAALADQPVVGRGVQVESVVADEGFWVGSSAEQRVFVFLTPEARQSAGESGYQVEAGQRIDLNGAVAELGASAPASFGVTEQEGAAQLTEQGAYVNATQVRLSGS